MEVVGQGGVTSPRKSCVGDSQALGTRLFSAPHQEDYRRTVTEIDEKEYISLRLIISELRNQYVTLHDMILKNIEKIKRPRSSNAETLY